MKVVLVMMLVLLAAATAFAYGGNVTEAMPFNEPALMLVFGGALIGAASALRRAGV